MNKQKKSTQKATPKNRSFQKVTSKKGSYKKRKKSKKKISKNRRIGILIGVVALLTGILFFSSTKGYQYKWENCGKAHVTKEFLDKVSDISERLNIDPDDLMAVMAFESQLNPARVNSYSGATGLIQWMPETAVELGTTTEKLKNMTAIDQLDYVYKYLKPYKGKLRTISDLYMSILWPAAVGKDEEYVLFEAGTIAYRQNDGLDVNEDGFITKKEAVQKVINNRENYFEEVNQ